MSLRNWFRLSPANKTITRPRCAASKRTPRCRLAVELLEDRTVPSTIQGTVFNDLDGDGTQDAGDLGLAGWTVFLDGPQTAPTSPNTILDPGEPSRLTNADGEYSFTGLDSPFYVVSRVLQVDQLGVPGRWVGTTQGMLGGMLNSSIVTVNFGVQYHEYADIVPVGGETLVNVGTAGAQGLQADWSSSAAQTVAADALGNFAIVWRSDDLGPILVRLFWANGTPRSGEITVVASSTNNFTMPRIAMADNGSFAVAWDTHNASTNTDVVYTRAYDAFGIPRTSAPVQVTPINSKVTNLVTGIAMDADGDYAVLYKGSKGIGGFRNDGIIGFQRYNALGQAAGNNTQVVDAGLINGNASLAMANDGSFVVVWDEADSGGSYVYAQRYSSAGRKSGGSPIVVTSGPGIRWQSSVAMNSTGQFVVEWGERGVGRFARVYSATGVSTAGPFAIGGSEEKTAVAMDDFGNVVFSWVEDDEVHFARWMPATGLGLDYIVNTTTQGKQTWPSIALTGTDSFVIAWNGYGAGDDAGVFFQRYDGPLP